MLLASSISVQTDVTVGEGTDGALLAAHRTPMQGSVKAYAVYSGLRRSKTAPRAGVLRIRLPLTPVFEKYSELTALCTA